MANGFGPPFPRPASAGEALHTETFFSAIQWVSRLLAGLYLPCHLSFRPVYVTYRPVESYLGVVAKKDVRGLAV